MGNYGQVVNIGKPLYIGNMVEDIEKTSEKPDESYDASDVVQVNSRQRRAKRKAKQDDIVLQTLLSTPDGRAWMFGLLAESHIFQSSYTSEPYSTAFKEGERNVGLKLLNHIMRACPEAFTQMLNERNAQ
jgi:hypothetical protein